MTPCAEDVGSKPWHRCGCRDDTPCRLGDAGSMAFLPWFVPRTQPPVQLREVGPDRGHLLTESCSGVSCVSMSNRGRGLQLLWLGKNTAKISLLVLALSLLDRGCCSSVTRCLVAATGVGAARTGAAASCCCCQQEVVIHRKPSDRVVGGAELCE